MSHLNQKDQKIKKLWDGGMRSKAEIARKIGYCNRNIMEGINRVEKGLARLGYRFTLTESE